MKKRLFSFAAIVTLAACSSSGGTIPPTVNPAPTQVRSVAVQRALAAQSLAATQSAAQFGGGGAAFIPILSIARKAEQHARQMEGSYRAGDSTPRAPRAATTNVAWGACTNSNENASVQVSATEWQYYSRDFYDAGCTKLWRDNYADVNASSQTSIDGIGTMATYDTGGTQTSYDTFTMSLAQPSSGVLTISMKLTTALNSTAPELSQNGIACQFTTLSQAATCGMGEVQHAKNANVDTGVTFAINNLTTTTANGVITIPIDTTLNTYTGSYNALTLAASPTFPSWMVTGGTAMSSSTAKGTVAAGSNGVQSVALTLTDSLNNATVTLVTSGSKINGTIIETSTGKQVATFSVDPSGNGTISYSDGTSATITDWILIG